MKLPAEYLTNDALSESTRAQFPDERAITLFRAALNSHLRSGASELHAYVKAYRFLEESGYQKGDDGKYVFKDGPTVSDVHVNRPMGGVKPEPQPAAEQLDIFTKRISGSSNVPLNTKGQALADELGKRLALKGGLDVLHASPLKRAQQTAAGITGHNAATKQAEPNADLQPWHLGEFEGQDGAEVKHRIAYFIEHPDERPPGKGADGKPAETFNEAKKRQLDCWSGLVKDSADEPTAKIGAVAHSRGVELLQAWVDAGCPDDYDLDDKDLLNPDDPDHASVLRLHKGELKEVPLDDDDPLKPGVYIILHSITDDDGDGGNKELEKRLPEKFVPPTEVQKAATVAYSAGVAALDITAALAEGEGLTEPGIRKLAEHFAANVMESAMSLNAWGGPLAKKWADRILRKLEKQRIEKAGNGVMVAFWPGADVAKKLAIAGGEKAEDLHLTLAYLGKSVDPDKLPALEAALKEFAAAHGSISGTIGGAGRFESSEHSDGKNVAYAKFRSEAIQEFRANLAKAIERVGLQLAGAAVKHGYTPHITLAYLNPGVALPVQRSDDPLEIDFDKLVLSVGGKRKEFPLAAGAVRKSVDVRLTGNITKLDGERRMAFGWFSIVSIDGRPVEDTQQDIISPETIEDAAYNFVLEARAGGEMHGRTEDNQPIVKGQLVESVVFTVEKQAAMVESLQKQGIPATLDLHCCAWWGGFKFNTDTWGKIKTGELRAWSIGGKAQREKIAA